MKTIKTYLKKIFSIISLLLCATLNTSAQKFTIKNEITFMNGITFMTIRSVVDQKGKTKRKGAREQKQVFTDVIVTNIPKLYNDKKIKSVISNDLPFCYEEKLYRIFGIEFDVFNKIRSDRKNQSNNQPLMIDNVPFVIDNITYTPIHNLINSTYDYIDVIITDFKNIYFPEIPIKFEHNQKKYRIVGINEDLPSISIKK